MINILTFRFFYFQMMTDFSFKKIFLKQTNTNKCVRQKSHVLSPEMKFPVRMA